MARVQFQSADAFDISADAEDQAKTEASALSERIRSAAQRKGWNQKLLAFQANVPAGRISEYWTGKREPGANYLFAIAKALTVSAEWLVTGSDGGFRQSDGNLAPTSEEKIMLTMFARLSAREREAVVSMLAVLSDSRTTLSSLQNDLKPTR